MLREEKMKFEHMEIREFNNKYGFNLKEEWNDNGNFYDCLLNAIDDSEYVSFFSSSFDEEDVLNDIIQEEPKLSLQLIEIENVYIALY